MVIGLAEPTSYSKLLTLTPGLFIIPGVSVTTQPCLTGSSRCSGPAATSSPPRTMQQLPLPRPAFRVSPACWGMHEGALASPCLLPGSYSDRLLCSWGGETWPHNPSLMTPRKELFILLLSKILWEVLSIPTCLVIKKDRILCLETTWYRGGEVPLKKKRCGGKEKERM